MSAEDGRKRAEMDAYIMEGNPGQYLHINVMEDGTWWDWTRSVWWAYWTTDLDALKHIALLEFSDFKEGYPKYHKVHYTYEMKEVNDDAG